MLEKSKNSKSLIILCFGLVLGFGALIVALPAHAQSDAGCAPDTWTAMTNRAAMETRREDVMNKRYIVKADSVLQYSCFRGELLRVANQTSRIFSNGTQWENREVPLSFGDPATVQIYAPSNPYDNNYNIGDSTLGFDSLSLHLDNVVGNGLAGPLFNYIDTNFGHNVLADTTNSNFHNICYNMSGVWRAAKCKNFDGIATFYSFEDLDGVPNFLSSPDPREFPNGADWECTL